MTPEQLRAAYFKGHGPVYPGPMWAEHMAAAHAAGLAEVARQQAEHDAQIAEREGHLWSGSPAMAFFEVANAIRAQFENVDRPTANPITATPEEN